MSNKVKDIDIKNLTHHFFDDNINIKIFDLNDIKIDEKSHKDILFTTFDMSRLKIWNM